MPFYLISPENIVVLDAFFKVSEDSSDTFWEYSNFWLLEQMSSDIISY